jgi:Tfp pilus assembly protein PilZ
MAAKTRRKYSRSFDHVPILYAGYGAKSYDKAVMHNSCMDGMYFESDSPIQPTGDLYIKIKGQREGSNVPEQYKDFRARVKWCRPVTADKMPCYGIGVQFTVKSHLSYGINSTDSDCLCDFCENRSSSKLIHRTETGLYLCPDCLHHMETLPRAIEKAVERFLLGNVV